MASASSWMRSHYNLLEMVGVGGCGRVYSAVPKRWGCLPITKPCACKVAKPNLESCLRNEANILKELRNVSNIVSVKEYHHDEDGGVLIMELCNCDLWEGIHKGLISCSEAKAANMFLKLAKTVKAIHDRGIVHRDLKPENILVARNKHLKVADFGSATHCRDGEMLSEPAGTARYSAPEMYRGSYGKQADVYSLGLILFALVEGVYPYKDVVADDECIFDFLADNAEAGVDIAGRYLKFTRASKDARELVLKMTAGDPSQRITLDEEEHAKTFWNAGNYSIDLSAGVRSMNPAEGSDPPPPRAKK